MNLYKQNAPEDFFNWLSKGKTLEIRFLNDFQGAHFNNYELIKELAETLKCDYRYSSLFIDSWEQVKYILVGRKINGVALTRLYNIFVSVNPKRKINALSRSNLIYKSYYGGIAGTSLIQTLLCDIEHTGNREGNASEAMIDECIQGAKHLITVLELSDYYLNISGNGVHLYIALNPAIPLPLPEARTITIKGVQKLKYNLKEPEIYKLIKTYNRYIEKLNSILHKFNPKLKVDEGAKDIARIARLSGSWNVKKNKTPRAVGTVLKSIKLNKGINKKFLAVAPMLNTRQKLMIKKLEVSKNHRYSADTLINAPLVQLLLSGLLPSTLSRNHYLEQNLARLLRDNNITIYEIETLISDIDMKQEKTIQIDPSYLEEDDEPFNPESINTYCYACHINFIYPILEDVTKVPEDLFITKEQSDILDVISDVSIDILTKQFIYKKSKDYFSLKMLIRNMIDKENRNYVFLYLKKLFKDDWAYHKPIVLGLLNKTRKKNE